MKGYRFQHWLSNYTLPSRIEDADLPDVIEEVKHGNREAMDRLTNGHIRLAMGLVARYHRPDISDDLVGAAFLGICKAVRYIAEGKLNHDNATGYIVTFIHGEIRRAIAGKNVVMSNNGSPAPQCFDLHDDRHVGGFPDTTMEVEEQINAIAGDETDLAIVRMLSLGYDGAEIARKLDIDRRRVSERVIRIRKTYKELENV